MTGTVIFDIGGVLIDWDPRHLYRQLFDDEAEMEHFLATVCTVDWIAEVDEGASLAESTEAFAAEHPDYAAQIRAYCTRWPETMGGAVEGTPDILRDLKQRGTPLYALANWGRESFDHAKAKFDFLQWFDGIVTSGEVGVRKPDRRIYKALIERYAIAPRSAVFIDDVAANVSAAKEMGMHGLLFTTPDLLCQELRQIDLL